MDLAAELPYEMTDEKMAELVTKAAIVNQLAMAQRGIPLPIMGGLLRLSVYAIKLPPLHKKEMLRHVDTSEATTLVKHMYDMLGLFAPPRYATYRGEKSGVIRIRRYN